MGAWLTEHLPAEAWVLDPFGAAPALGVEAARAGYRVVITASNPIARFLLEMEATPPDGDELRAALAELAAARKGEERLEPHMLSLYATPCASCGRQVSAEAFLWERDAEAPFARIYTCPHCGDRGERPATEADAARAARFSGRGLHRALALQRVAPANDPDRAHAQEALAVYHSRALYALVTLLNRLDGLGLARRARRLLNALLISAFDRANTLWPYPVRRARPRQLTVPPQHYEYNVWRALESAVEQWADAQHAVPLVRWPEPPRPGGISVFAGRLKDLARELEEPRFDAVVAALPRLNQAYWTLSALWSAWLWGREALGAFVSVLRRRRYDWGWHATALHASLAELAACVRPDTPFFGVVAEAEPGFLTAATLAAHLAGFALDGLALRAAAGQAQYHWRRRTGGSSAPERALPMGALRRAARDHLGALGEPAPYLPLHAAALHVQAGENAWPDAGRSLSETVTRIHDRMEAAFSNDPELRRFEGSEHSLEVGHWWLSDPAGAGPPLADRLELALYAYLETHPGSDLTDLDAAACREFPGLLTPPRALVHACLESYGREDPEHGWTLRPEEARDRRREDLEGMRRLLRALGEQLDYRVQSGERVIWEQDGEIAFTFTVQATAGLEPLLAPPDSPAGKRWVVLPGGRANLILFKLRRDPRLVSMDRTGWGFLKFRHLRRLAESGLLTPDSLEDQLALDPLTYAEPQIPLL